MKVFTESVAEKLQKKYDEKKVEIKNAMNYGQPKIKHELKKMMERDVKKYLFFQCILNIQQQQQRQS